MKVCQGSMASKKEVGEIGIAQLDFSTQDGKELPVGPEGFGQREILSKHRLGRVTWGDSK